MMSILTTNRKPWRSSHELQKQTLFGCSVRRQYFKQTLDCWRVQSVAMIWTTRLHQILDGPWFKRAAAEQLVQLNNKTTDRVSHYTRLIRHRKVISQTTVLAINALVETTKLGENTQKKPLKETILP